MVSKASDDLPDPDRPVKTTSLSRGIDRVTFLRLCSRAPRIVIWSIGIRTLVHSLSLVTANVALAVAPSRPSLPSTRHSVTTVRRPAWMTWPVARRVSPILAALMKLSIRSKLMARETPGFSVRSHRARAESASVLIIPPCTKPEWLAMSSVALISTTAVPSPVSTSCRPSKAQARDGDLESGSPPALRGTSPRGGEEILESGSPPPLRGTSPRAGEEILESGSPSPLRGTSPRGGEVTFLFTALPLRHGHARRGSARDKAPPIVDHVGLAEEQRLLHLDNAADCPQASVDDRAQEVDLQLDGGVPEAVLLERAERHPHRRVSDLRDDAALHHTTAVPVLRTGFELQHNPARLGLCDASAQGLHPPSRLSRDHGTRAVHVLHGPRRDFLQFRTIVFCLGAAAIARATSASSSLPDSSPASRLRSAMIRSRTRAASSNCSSFDSRRISFSRSRAIASRSSRGTPAPTMSSTASAWMSFSLISSA